MLFFGLTCLGLTLITFERIELQSSDWIQNARFFKLYQNMPFDSIVLCSLSDGDFKFGFFIDLSCSTPVSFFTVLCKKADISAQFCNDALHERYESK